jgi:hypothetical protein
MNMKIIMNAITIFMSLKNKIDFEHIPNHAQMNTNVPYTNCATSREKLKNIYLWKTIICLFFPFHVEISHTTMPFATLLVPLESPW